MRLIKRIICFFAGHAWTNYSRCFFYCDWHCKRCHCSEEFGEFETIPSLLWRLRKWQLERRNRRSRTDTNDDVPF